MRNTYIVIAILFAVMLAIALMARDASSENRQKANGIKCERAFPDSKPVQLLCWERLNNFHDIKDIVDQYSAKKEVPSGLSK